MNQRLLAVGLVALLLAGCAGAPRDRPTEQTPRRGGYYQNDGPGDDPPANLEAIADAQPRYEPLHRFANRPYSVLGRDYVPAQSHRPHREQGIASWYGRQFHGKKTAIGETYDMYAMTAAHPTLPLPSYARVTHLASQKRVVVRVNDRGPFHPGRVIDLSYVAAHKLGLAQKGSAEVLVEALLPGGEVTAPTPAVAQAPAEAMEPVPLPMALERSGYFLQLGAFGNFANAESFLKHVQAQVVWLGESAHIAPREGLYRVQMGPYPDAAEARRIGELVREAMNLEANLRKD
jgi:rare lipoprotein A